MFKSLLLQFAFLFSLVTIPPVSFANPQQEATNQVEITYPQGGNAVQGLVQIIGTVNPVDFQSYRLEFSPQNSPSSSWFPIHQQSSPVVNDVLGEWDTSVLTDGNYLLRLSVYTHSGETTSILIEGIRIRNYSPIETETPKPTRENILPTITSTPFATLSPTATIQPSPTSLPANPISLGNDTIQKAAVTGSIIGFIGVLFILLYIGYRQKP